MSSLRLAVLLISILSLMIAFYAFLIIYISRAPCVVLPNGYMIGHIAVFSGGIVSSENMVLRSPDGEVLAGNVRSVNFFLDPETPRGVVMFYDGGSVKMPGDEIMTAIWDERPFSGKWYERGEKYKRSDHIVFYDLSVLFDDLIGHPGIDMSFCGTPWFDRGA